MSLILTALIAPWVAIGINKLSNSAIEREKLRKEAIDREKQWYPQVMSFLEAHGVKHIHYNSLCDSKSEVFFDSQHYKMYIVDDKHYVAFIPTEAEYEKGVNLREAIQIIPIENILFMMSEKQICNKDKVYYKGEKLTDAFINATKSVATESYIKEQLPSYFPRYNDKRYLYYTDNETKTIKAVLFYPCLFYLTFSHYFPETIVSEIQLSAGENQKETLLFDRSNESLEMVLQRLKEWRVAGLLAETNYKHKEEIILKRMNKNNQKDIR